MDGLVSWGFGIVANPFSIRACPREPALEPNNGISFLVEKFRGLLPRTTMGAVVLSARMA
jgi:hypothetical protein